MTEAAPVRAGSDLSASLWWGTSGEMVTRSGEYDASGMPSLSRCQLLASHHTILVIFHHTETCDSPDSPGETTRGRDGPGHHLTPGHGSSLPCLMGVSSLWTSDSSQGLPDFDRVGSVAHSRRLMHTLEIPPAGRNPRYSRM